MKKYFVYSLMTASFGMLLASCGGKTTSAEGVDSTATEAPAAQQGEKLSYTDDDVKAITGITAFDVKLDGITGMSGQNNATGFDAELTPSENSLDNFEAYNVAFFKLLQSVATDGKVLTSDLTELTEPSHVDSEALIQLFTYIYKYNGELVYATITNRAGEELDHYKVSVSK